MAFPVGQAQVQDHQIGAACSSQRQPFLAIGREQYLVAFGAKADIQEFSDLCLVVDHEDTGDRSGHGGVGSGNVMRIVVPMPSPGKASTLPPWAPIMPRQIARPRPVP